MIIKKIQAKTETEAVEAAKKELGQGVVVMNVKQVKKKGLFAFLKPTMVEVTVALEEDTERVATTEKSPSMTALEKLAKAQEAKMKEEKTVAQSGADVILETREEKKEATNALEEKLDSLENLLKQKLETASEGEKKEAEIEEEPTEQMRFMKLLYNVMIDNEVHEKYANQIIEDAEKNSTPNMPFDYCLTNIYQKMILKFGQPKVIEPAKEGPKLVFFLGPTGVGKTTTIAKIASRLSLEEKSKVVLLTADTYRIAAAEQLRTYANILEVPFRVIYTGQEIQQAYEEFAEYDYILVDTAGHSHNNEEQRNNINQLLHYMDDIVKPEVYLVLSATTKYRDLISIADTYGGTTEYRLIFTKLDETTALGNLLNLRLHTNADLSYVTYGQNVPEDMEQFNPQTTVKQILGGKV